MLKLTFRVLQIRCDQRAPQTKCKGDMRKVWKRDVL